MGPDSTLAAKTATIDAAGVIRGGMVLLDRDAELQSVSRRRVRVHELGHVLGTSHVTSRVSFMNPDGNGGLPGEADIEAFRVAARRPPGNRSPEVDPADFTVNTPVRSAQRSRFSSASETMNPNAGQPPD